MDLPGAILSHRTPHRVRVKIPERKGDAAYFQGVIRVLSELPAIQRLEANPLTGSVLVETEEKDFDLGAAAKELGLFALNISRRPDLPFHEVFSEHIRQVNLELKDFTGGGIDLTGLLFLGLLALGLFQMMEGNLVVPAVTAFWYAMNLLAAPSPPAVLS